MFWMAAIPAIAGAVSSLGGGKDKKEAKGGGEETNRQVADLVDRLTAKGVDPNVAAQVAQQASSGKEEQGGGGGGLMDVVGKLAGAVGGGGGGGGGLNLFG